MHHPFCQDYRSLSAPLKWHKRSRAPNFTPVFLQVGACCLLFRPQGVKGANNRAARNGVCVCGGGIPAVSPKQTPANFHFANFSCCGHLRGSKTMWRKPHPHSTSLAGITLRPTLSLADRRSDLHSLIIGVKQRSWEEENASCSVWADYIIPDIKYTEALPFDGTGIKCFCDLLDVNYIKTGAPCCMHDLHSGDQNLLPAENQLVRFDWMWGVHDEDWLDGLGWQSVAIVADRLQKLLQSSF